MVASTGKIQTVAGNGAALQSGCNGGVNACIGVGGPAIEAVVPGPLQVAVDSSGNIYIPIQTEFRNMIDEVVASTGDLQIFAANGAQDFTGTNGPAVSAQLNIPNFAVTDGTGNVFIADANNNVIYEIVAATGILKIVAGTGVAGYSGDGGPATSAELANPFTVVVDGSGNLFIADTVNSVIREVVAATGFMKTVAGNASAACNYTLGDSGPANERVLVLSQLRRPGQPRKHFHCRQWLQPHSGGKRFDRRHTNGGRKWRRKWIRIQWRWRAEKRARRFAEQDPESVFADSSGNFFIADQFNNVIRQEQHLRALLQPWRATRLGPQDSAGMAGPPSARNCFYREMCGEIA